MKRLSLGFLAFLALFALAAAMGRGASVDVRDLMTANQFRSAGLAKLSDSQLDALNTALSGIAPAADKAIDLRDYLTVNQFHNAGLDTLSSDEMATLNVWFNGRFRAENTRTPASASPVPAASAASAFGADMVAPSRKEPDSIESRILGTFKGWSGRTVFKLENGQVWQQAEGGTFNTTMQNPTVVIKKLTWGYLLTLPGDSDTVFVRRIH